MSVCRACAATRPTLTAPEWLGQMAPRGGIKRVPHRHIRAAKSPWYQGQGASPQPPGDLGCILLMFKSLSRFRLFATPWTTAHQASLSITNSWSSLKLMSTESVMPSNHLILCRPLLLLPSIFPSIRVFSNESALRIRWPKYWSFSFSSTPSEEYSGLISLSVAKPDLYNCMTCLLWAAPSSQSLKSQVQAKARSTPESNPTPSGR